MKNLRSETAYAESVSKLCRYSNDGAGNRVSEGPDWTAWCYLVSPSEPYREEVWNFLHDIKLSLQQKFRRKNEEYQP